MSSTNVYRSRRICQEDDTEALQAQEPFWTELPTTDMGQYKGTENRGHTIFIPGFGSIEF